MGHRLTLYMQEGHFHYIKRPGPSGEPQPIDNGLFTEVLSAQLVIPTILGATRPVHRRIDQEVFAIGVKRRRDSTISV